MLLYLLHCSYKQFRDAGAFFKFFLKTLIFLWKVQISLNVLAVDDVLPARIRALRSKDQGWQNVGGVGRGNGAKRNDLATRNPEGL
jgi:hypothetical protein